MAAEGTQGAAEQLRLRERLAKLRELPLLRGVGVSGEMARLQRQIERIGAEPTEDDGAAVELAEAGDHRAVVAEGTVAVQLEPVLEQPLHVVERVGPIVMARLKVPIVACVIGEGGSGGAIAIALADRVLMQENAIYSVISPEGCAAILWRDAGQAKKAAAAFRPDAVHCQELGVVDEIVPEPVGGAHIDPDMAARLLGQALRESLAELEGTPGDDLRRRRRARFRSLGVFA